MVQCGRLSWLLSGFDCTINILCLIWSYLDARAADWPWEQCRVLKSHVLWFPRWLYVSSPYARQRWSVSQWWSSVWRCRRRVWLSPSEPLSSPMLTHLHRSYWRSRPIQCPIQYQNFLRWTSSEAPTTALYLDRPAAPLNTYVNRVIYRTTRSSADAEIVRHASRGTRIWRVPRTRFRAFSVAVGAHSIRQMRFPINVLYWSTMRSLHRFWDCCHRSGRIWYHRILRSGSASACR